MSTGSGGINTDVPVRLTEKKKNNYLRGILGDAGLTLEEGALRRALANILADGGVFGRPQMIRIEAL